MSLVITPEIQYPESDGNPMADNTLQFTWISIIKWGLEGVFRDRPDVFVAGDLLWYPVEGNNKLRAAPDAMVVFGRPKGDRGSYLQWQEDDIAPQAVFEVLSPGNRPLEMVQKERFYERYGVEEYYIFDPDSVELSGWLRQGELFRPIENMNGWVSPLLRIRFDVVNGELHITGPDGKRFLTPLELIEQRDELTAERDELVAERDELAAERDQLAIQHKRERQEKEQALAKLSELEAQLKALGQSPTR
ncbi:MAG TPA: Uma2 family endonuclease [Planctomycetaceae bacterium]|nr:Uma2 family endonuclease [Planctomycetaceae bacterium]